MLRDYYDKSNMKKILDQIKYRGTILTGEITKDNGDGTYDVKINQATKAYPNVETAFYGETFSVKEIVIVTFEDGNKERPRIWGHGKKVPQDPKKVEVDYTGKQTIIKTIYSNANDGDITNSAEIYITAHNDDGSGENIIITDSGEGGDIIGIGQNFATDYIIKRGFLFFDTSIIPGNAKITSVILNIYADSLPGINFNIVIQDGQPNYPHSPLINSDYYCGNYFNNGGQIAITEVLTGAYSNIILNDNGKNWINKGGITELCLRSSKDIALVAPTDWEVINFYSSEKGEGFAPKLIITYEI